MVRAIAFDLPPVTFIASYRERQWPSWVTTSERQRVQTRPLSHNGIAWTWEISCPYPRSSVSICFQRCDRCFQTFRVQCVKSRSTFSRDTLQIIAILIDQRHRGVGALISVPRSMLTHPRIWELCRVGQMWKCQCTKSSGAWTVLICQPLTTVAPSPIVFEETKCKVGLDSCRAYRVCHAMQNSGLHYPLGLRRGKSPLLVLLGILIFINECL